MAKNLNKARSEKDILNEQLRQGKWENEELHKSVHSLAAKAKQLEDVHMAREVEFAHSTKEQEEKF